MTMTRTELKSVMESRRDFFRSLQGLWDAGRAVGNPEAYVSRRQILQAEQALYDAYVDWTCA